MTAVGAPPRAYFADHARGWGAGVVASCLDARGRNDNARSVKSSIEEATGSYGGRFFVELLQNAHDAHPAGSAGGKVLMLLDETEGPHGTVYAADAGAGFDEENFRAISNLALSNKPVGEGIGNKGVGFKSVLQVCESPEIYSCDPQDPARDGFCFGFADHDQLRDLTADDDELSWVLDNVSRYTVPVPIARVPETARALRDEGYSTVLRLPLRSAVAAQEADRRFGQLGAGTVPMTLFLTRIDSLELRRRTPVGTAARVLERHAEPLPLPGDGAPAAELVTVEQGRTFLLLTRQVDRAALMAALHESVRRERLKAKWLSWDAPAYVAVAVPYGWEDADDFRLYTYLPMGEDARAPLHGHLHAPFFTDYARKGLEWDHPLNAMLVDTAAALAVDGAGALLASGAANEQDRLAAVDLVSWQPERSSHLPGGAEDCPVLPGLDGRAVPMARARLWREDFEWDVLTAEHAQRAAGLDVLAAGLGEDRLGRLRATAAARGLALDLGPAELAGAAEAIAAKCHADGLPPSRWDLLYDDLAYLFDDAAKARQLAGRRLLLADDGSLRSCAAPAPDAGTPTAGDGRGKAKSGGAARRGRTASAEAAFFPPVRLRTDDEDEVDPDVDLDLPESLRGRLFFLHADLTWHDENRQPNPARDLLMNYRLVRKFDARSLAEHVRGVLAGTAAQRAHRDGLRFLYNLQRSRPSTALPLADSNVRLPAADGGTVPAARALFSRDWPGTRGADLEAVASAPADTAPELAALRGRLLARPDDLLRPADDRPAWTAFLRRLGVQDVLPVHSVRDARELFGSQLCRPALSAALGVPGPIASAWAPALPALSGAYATQTEYKTAGRVTWLPGQAEFDALPRPVQAAYARLLLAGLEQWPEELLTTVWERDRPGNRDPQRVPTPLGAFVARGRWLPVHDPSARREAPAAPRDAWHFRGGTDTEPPRFAPIVARAFRAQIDAAPAAARRLREAGMRVWNDRADAERHADHLAELLRMGRVDAAFLPHLANAYRAAWAAALERPAGPVPARGRALIVRVGTDLAALPLPDAPRTGPVVVTDDADDAFHRRVAAEFGLPVLHLDAKADEALARLQGWAPGSAVRPPALDIRVRLDGTDLAPAGDRPALAQAVPWLRPLVSMVLLHRLPAQERPGDARLRQVLEVLGRIRIATGSRIEVRIGDAVRAAPARLRGVMPLPDAGHPTLVIEAADGGVLGWDHLDALAGPLMQLLGYPRTATDLRLCLAKLRRSGAEPEDPVDWVELADSCDVDQDDAAHTLARLGNDSEETTRRARLLAANLWGDDAARLVGAEGLATDEQLGQAVMAAARAGGGTTEQALRLLAAARDAPTLDDARKVLGIPLAGMNATLAAHDPPQPLIDYGPEHAEAFELAVLAHGPGLLDQLRWARLDAYRATRPIPGWPALRALASLRPDPAWAHTVESLDEQTALREAERQLAARLGAPLPRSGSQLEPMAVLRARNRPVAEAAVLDAAPAARAWCRKNGADVPAALADPTDPRPALALLDDAGALDFADLTKDAVLAWARAAGAWPERMEATDDLGRLGLSVQDLAAEQSEEEQARQRRQRERRTVHVDGTAVDVGNGMLELRERILASLADSPEFLRATARNARLGQPPTTGGRGGGQRPGAGGPPADRASDQQLAAVGFAGELLAYRWLLERYPAQVTEACWKSRNRAEAFTGDPGRDDLGYDFAVPFKGGTVMYEVKATTGDGGEFQLGESEVRAAQENLRNNNWRLLVVTNALTRHRRIRQLRNPFHPKSRGEFTFAGKGLRLLYRAD